MKGNRAIEPRSAGVFADDESVSKQNRSPIAALALAGALWGLSVPLSKLSLAWMAPAWLTVARFSLAAPILAVAGRRGLRGAMTFRVLASGAIGFGAVLVLQNAGIERTSVSHAAVLVGAVPVLVALIAAARGHGVPHAHAWGGYALGLGGIFLVAGSGGSGASVAGDLLVLASAALSAGLIVAQPALLQGQDPAAVTSVQFAGGALAALPLALLAEPVPASPRDLAVVGVFAALTLAGTVVPFWLFAFGQTRVPAQLAGAYVNLEPVVGAAVGWFAFGERAAIGQLAGAAAVLAGIGLSSLTRSASDPRGADASGAQPCLPARREIAVAEPAGCPSRRARLSSRHAAVRDRWRRAPAYRGPSATRPRGDRTDLRHPARSPLR